MTKESKAKKANNEARKTAEETTENARRTVEEAAGAGQRMSEEALQMWFRLMDGAGWQRQFERFNEAASHLVPLFRRNCEEMFEMWRTSTRSGSELLKRSLETARSPMAEKNQENFVEMWLATIRTAQSNIEAATQYGTRAVDSWTAFLRRNVEAGASTAS